MVTAAMKLKVIGRTDAEAPTLWPPDAKSRLTGKTIALTVWTFVRKVMSLLFNMLSRLVITFLPRSKGLFISWLQSPSAVILEPPKIKSATVYCHRKFQVYNRVV